MNPRSLGEEYVTVILSFRRKLQIPGGTKPQRLK